MLISFGETKVLCTATVEERVPSFMSGKGSGWVTAEYAMLPRSSQSRISRDSNKKGRAVEISRLIGRSLRAVTDLPGLGERQIIIDCDVLQADGGTRTAAITGGYIALHDALTGLIEKGLLSAYPLFGQCAAVSVGVIDGEPRLDLCYLEDFRAEVDMNVAMRSDGAYIEVQGSAEGGVFSRDAHDALLDLAAAGIQELFQKQLQALEP